MQPSRSEFIDVRGLRYHVRRWGPAQAPLIFLLHGWMDVSASFQFLVDAFSREYSVVAPDWRGFGLSEWAPGGYWFADYLADLDALLEHYAPHQMVDLIGHSLGGNAVCIYSGVRAHRVRRAVSLDAFGPPAEWPAQAPKKLVAWLDALRHPPGFRPYPSLAAVADRLQQNNARMTRVKAEFLAGHWAEELSDGTARLRSDPQHKLPFPALFRIEELLAIWSAATAPILWMGAQESFMLQWITRGDAAGLFGMERRKAAWRDLRYAEIPQAGHMLHHDQPELVAAQIESFLI